jgi:hypothetical protein
LPVNQLTGQLANRLTGQLFALFYFFIREEGKMSTTHVFAELLIIGIETMAWITLLIFSLFGYHWIDFSLFENLVIAIPLAAAAYVLGIIMDRLSDVLLSGPDHTTRVQAMGPRAAESFGQLRSYVLAKSPHLATDLDYLRSRLRIMRSSVINFGILGVTGTAFILSRIKIDLDTQYWAAVTAFFAGAFLSGLSFYAWRASSITYYLRLKIAFALLPEEEWSTSQEKKEEQPESKPSSSPGPGSNGRGGGNGV